MRLFHHHRTITLTAFLCVGLLASCGDRNVPSTAAPMTDVASETKAPEDEKGPHGGKLLREGNFALEMTIFETGVPPQYRIYPYLNGAPVNPAQIDLTVKLHRLGGIVDRFSFASKQDYLVGDGVVIEPHSFEVEVEAGHSGKLFQWRYDSFEGRTKIPDDIAAEAGVRVEIVGPAVIHDVLALSGTVTLSPSATAEVRATYPGPVKSVSVAVGDRVKRGQTIARIESSSSLQEYEVKAPKSGIIQTRNTNTGSVAGSEALFVIADYGQIEAHLHVFPRDMSKVEVGQAVRLGFAGGELNVESKISRFLPYAGVNSQTRIAVVKIPANSGLQPGTRIAGEVIVAETEVPMAVKQTGLQSFRDFTVVFAKVDETYEVRMLELGRSDRQHIEVLGGLRSDEIYVTENSFLIKADVEKSGASHDH